MKRGFYLIMAAQFFSSLADNALFIAAIALIQQLDGPDWMTPMIKWSFALAYVLLAAFVGAFADSFPKGRVMFATNSVKIIGCLMMFAHASLGLADEHQVYTVCAAYALVGIGAAAYSPAKYGIITELLPPEQLVKGNSWIEGLTVVSIILGVVLGGALISPKVSAWLLSIDLGGLGPELETPAEAAIVVIALVYLVAAVFNLLIPSTGVDYPQQQRNPIKLLATFGCFVATLWRDKLGQISLAVTTLFWGAGATLQLIVIEWGRVQLGLPLNKASILMGVASVGTILGATLAGKVPLHHALAVLPMGVLMGLVVMLMPLAYEPWFVYTLLIAIGGLGGFFVVPMNALLQHRGHVLLSAGHSIAVQNFNEQLNILLMVAAYSLMLGMEIPINTIIIIFGTLVACLMVLIMIWNRHNHRTHPDLDLVIGSRAHGTALHRD
ncbi:lysophospholipid transporter LplT [Pigmentiphaga sp. NML080357]|uniref:lysophospholipid transporter LplT n=1 Tax=Pigmentiphaga sp. NML080357 TaxID=2008675 RepID=UPI000B41AC25|nr:lysophospholipid transporter LplT [Pigmentiphaga sp. NML080357]OVZ62157.1 lysophospholipid transporter LplT [Pigmentiphaga sp. NML080357]